MNEIFILQLIIILIASTFGIMILKMVYTLLTKGNIEKKVNTALTEIGKLKSNFKNLETSPNKKELPDLSSLDLNSISIDQLAEQLGFDTSSSTFQLLKPTLEKHFDQYKKEQKTGSDDSIGLGGAF